MPQPHHDVIIVGTGPGTAFVANELSRTGAKVLIIDAGRFVPGDRGLVHTLKMTTFRWIGFPKAIVHGMTLGGSTQLYYGTAVAPPQQFFGRLGIAIKKPAQLAAQKVPTRVVEMLPEKAERLQTAARSLGLDWQGLPKFIGNKPNLRSDHIWRSTECVNEALRHGATMVQEATVHRILHKNGRVQGVCYRKDRKTFEAFADRVILGAGGLGTPGILQQSGISNAGSTLYCDPIIVVSGRVPQMRAGYEAPMLAGCYLPDDGVMLSDLQLIPGLFRAFALAAGKLPRYGQTLSLMVKIKDDDIGSVRGQHVHKVLTAQDRAKLQHGFRICETILKEAGATSVYSSPIMAAHPGGTAAIDVVVDRHLESSIRGLHILDASVIPGPWGLPPVWTLLALGQYLANVLS